MSVTLSPTDFVEEMARQHASSNMRGPWIVVEEWHQTPLPYFAIRAHAELIAQEALFQVLFGQPSAPKVG